MPRIQVRIVFLPARNVLFSRERALSPPFSNSASVLPPTRSKYYNGAAKLIEDTPVRPLSEYLRILSWEGSGKIFAVFRAKIRCDKPMMMRSGGVSRSDMQPILGKVHQLPEALQWLLGWVWGKPREAVNRVSSLGCDEGIVTLAQKIERIPERSFGSYWSPSLEHSAMVPFQLCDGDVCAHVSFEGLDFSGAATTIRSETALIPQPPGVQSKDNLQASVHVHTQAHAHTRAHACTHAELKKRSLLNLINKIRIFFVSGEFALSSRSAMRALVCGGVLNTNFQI